MTFFPFASAKPTQFNFNAYNSEQFQMSEALFPGFWLKSLGDFVTSGKYAVICGGMDPKRIWTPYLLICLRDVGSTAV